MKRSSFIKTLAAFLFVSCLKLRAAAIKNRIFMGIKQTASQDDKNLLASTIRDKFDPSFKKSLAKKFRKKTNHSLVYICNNWDLDSINVKPNFSVQKANDWLDAHAEDFDNRNNIVVVGAMPSNWELVPDEE